MQRLKVLLVYGTRPEAIKMAPVVAALRAEPEVFESFVLATGQHREMVAQVEEALGLVPDLDLDLMQPDQSLNRLASRVLARMEEVLERERPDWVLVQGDTTSAMIAGLAAFHRRIRVGHVEAGLRSGRLDQPFPEEANRRLIDRLASALFAPTRRAVEALAAEGADPAAVHLTGNTIVDALRTLLERLPEEPAEDREQVLVTVHRRESFGLPLRQILAAVSELAERFPAVRWLVPVHPNPHVRQAVEQALGGLSAVELRPPLDYLTLLRELRRSRCVLTDSGGIQEEAPVLGKPVLVLREVTERPEGIEAGVARLVGVSRERIVAAASRLLIDGEEYRRMARAVSPYGDGAAALRIADALAGRSFRPFTASETPGSRTTDAGGGAEATGS